MTIKLLVEAGANIDFAQGTNRSALFAARLGKHADAVRVLLEPGAKD